MAQWYRLKGSQAGVTLIELILVLVIVVLGLSIIGPAVFSGRSSTDIKTATRDMGSALRYVRGQAIAQQKKSALTVDLNSNEYLIDDGDRRFSIAEQIAITLVTAQTEITGEGTGNIVFFPDGSSTGGRITLEAEGYKRVIDINWLTGNVEVNDASEDQ